MSDFMDKKLDMKNFGAQLKMTFGLKFRPSELQALMAHFDKDGDGTINYGEFTNAFFKLGKEARAEQRKSPAHIALQYGTASEVSKIFLKRFREKLGIGYKDGLKAHFQKYDLDGSGAIGSREFRRVLMDFNIRVTNQQFDQIMQIFDMDGSQEIDFKEFVSILENQDAINSQFRATLHPELLDWQITGQFASSVAKKWDKVAAAFIAFDKQQTGNLSYGEMKLILQRLDVIDERMTDERFRVLMKHYDTNEDGNIGYVEFLKHFATSVSDTHLDRKFGVNERIQPLFGNQGDSMVIENDSGFKLMATSRWPKVIRQIHLIAAQDNTGFVTQSQFRRILDSCSICLSNSYFDDLCHRFEVSAHANYFSHDSFMEELCLQGIANVSVRPASSHSSLRPLSSNPSLSQKEMSISSLQQNKLTPENLCVIEKIEKKIQQMMKKEAAKVRKVFECHEKDGDGLVDKGGFLASLNSLNVGITPEEGHLVWKKHATVRKGGGRYASYRAVLKTIFESRHANNQSGHASILRKGNSGSPPGSFSRGLRSAQFGNSTWEFEKIESSRPKTAVVAEKMKVLDNQRCRVICKSWKDIRSQFQQRDRDPL